MIDGEKANIGVLIVLDKPTKPMKTKAISKGIYKSSFIGRSYPRLQIRTVEDLFGGKRVEIPGMVMAVQKAKGKPAATGELDL